MAMGMKRELRSSYDEALGKVLECNVIVHETDSGATVVAIDPTQAVAGQPQLMAVAEKVRAKLQRVLEQVQERA